MKKKVRVVHLALSRDKLRGRYKSVWAQFRAACGCRGTRNGVLVTGDIKRVTCMKCSGMHFADWNSCSIEVPATLMSWQEWRKMK